MAEKNRSQNDHDAVHGAQYHAEDRNDRLIIHLRDLGHIMRFLYEGKASQKRILMILKKSESMTQKDLTERLGIQPGSASEILLKLENAGLITRTRNEHDRRTTDICLTDSGRELAEEALAQRKKRHEEMFSCLSEKEKQELLSLLEKLCADWKSRYSESGNAQGSGHPGQGRHEQGHHEQGHHEQGHHEQGCHEQGHHEQGRHKQGSHIHERFGDPHRYGGN